MSYKVLFVINAVVVFVLGLAMVFVPVTVLTQFGTETRVPELLLARFFGAALATVGLLLWFAKDAAEETVQKNLALALLIGTVLGLIVTVMGMTGSRAVIRSNGWIALILEVVFALGYAFLLFLRPRMKEEPLSQPA
jgi:heme/copper-type cytochrome/quinol oxidase subunit 3